MPSLLRSLAVAATVVTWLPPVVYGAGWPAYSAARDYVSELGAAGAPDAGAVNASFALAGGLILGLCLALARRAPGLRLPLALVSAVGVSYLVAAVVPCDAGCPAEGSDTQAIHNAVGGLGYLLGGLGLLAAARPIRAAGHVGLSWSARVAGVVVLVGLVAMGAPELAETRGAAQRVVELAVSTWLLAAAWVGGATSASSDPRPTSAPA